MNKEAREVYINSFENEISKQADFIPKDVYKKLDDYTKRRLVEARDVIAEATKKNSKLPRLIREKIIAAAFEMAKNQSYELASASAREKSLEELPTVANPKSKLKPPLSL